MKRRDLILAYLMAKPQVNQEDIDEFTKTWVEFYKTEIGCLNNGDIVCNPSKGYWDGKKFKKARELAKKVFDLDERR